jgi:hypothetical protein
MKLLRGDIETDFQRQTELIIPTFGLTDSFLHNPFADFENVVDLLGNRYKNIRRNNAVIGAIPADEGLCANELLSGQRILLLV